MAMMMKNIFLIIIILFSYEIKCEEDQQICNVCYSEPCDISNSSLGDLLFCSISANSTQCAPCPVNCSQCLNLTNTTFTCFCPVTTAPTTASPTIAPTTIAPTEINTTYSPTVPTNSPTSAPTVFFECTFCNNTSPPPSLPCNGSSQLLMLCETEAGPNMCLPCPVFCSFCFPILAPTPFYICTCPPTGAPTETPTTLSPTVAPTGSPTTAAPTFTPIPFMDLTMSLILLAFAIGVAVLCIFCIMFIMPAGMHRYSKNDELNYYNVQNKEEEEEEEEGEEGDEGDDQNLSSSLNNNNNYYGSDVRKRLQNYV